MTSETYLIDSATLGGVTLPELRVLILYDADSESPHGMLAFRSNLPEQLAAGWRSGPLVVRGRREQPVWNVEIAEIEIIETAADRAEFLIAGRVNREPAT